MQNENIFQYKLFQSFVHPSFWHKLSETKIEIDGLNEDRKPINGFYTNNDSTHCLMEVDCTSFNQRFDEQSLKHQCHGAILNKNKIEDFKTCDKVALLNGEGKLIWNDIESGKWIINPTLLSRFFILSFADLKTFNYYYWFSYPCPSEPLVLKSNKSKLLLNELSDDTFVTLTNLYFGLSNCERSFFIVNQQLEYFKLSDKIDAQNKEDNFSGADLSTLYFCFSDPCVSNDIAGWPLRLFVIALAHFCPKLRGKDINVISLRAKRAVSIENSIVFTIRLPESDVDKNALRWIGWEPNTHGKYLPNCASMASSMDPIKLAENGILLNLKLMKWRLLPNLDLKKISTMKCLLFGAGTLGCAVSRNLIAWGIQSITFIDSGYVSYANPVRQNLYTYEDAVNRREKAKTAANRLLELCPGLNTCGHYMRIPMPGFPVGESMRAKTISAISGVESLIDEHDAIFLLTDSRESRWLPTMLAAAKNKIVINAALGFDSYLVMRHGSNPETEEPSTSQSSTVQGLKYIDGSKLGCYFCNDVTAPGDSQKDRTLDQQCTVTRPAVSNIAASLAVELLISLTQHPKKASCPAYISVSNVDAKETKAAIPEELLGIVPHSIRGMISNFEQIIPATERFPNCIACSKRIVDEYKRNGNEFLFKVFDTSKHLEDISGISELLSEEHDEIVELDSDCECSLSD